MSKRPAGPWVFSPGKKREPHAVLTRAGAFIAEVDNPKVGRLIVEILGALDEAADVLQLHAGVSGREFQAWKRARSVLDRAGGAS